MTIKTGPDRAIELIELYFELETARAQQEADDALAKLAARQSEEKQFLVERKISTEWREHLNVATWVARRAINARSEDGRQCMEDVATVRQWLTDEGYPLHYGPPTR